MKNCISCLWASGGDAYSCLHPEIGFIYHVYPIRDNCLGWTKSKLLGYIDNNPIYEGDYCFLSVDCDEDAIPF